MVASIDHTELFEKSKKLFEKGDILNTLENYEKAIHLGANTSGIFYNLAQPR